MDFKEQIASLKETIESLQKKIKDLEKSCEKSYELPECNDYYCIEECYNGKFISSQYYSNLIPKEQNDNYRKGSNYFSSDIEAKCLASMFNTLLTISKYKRIVEPNTNLNDGTWMVARHIEEGWIPMKEMNLFRTPYIVYFQTKEHCQEACDILNREDFRC